MWCQCQAGLPLRWYWPIDALETLKRWRALDWCLEHNGLHVPTFARDFGVSQRTVYRDLDLFRALGKRIESFREPSRLYGVTQLTRDVVTLWGYTLRVRPLFLSSLRPIRPHEPKGGGGGEHQTFDEGAGMARTGERTTRPPCTTTSAP